MKMRYAFYLFFSINVFSQEVKNINIVLSLENCSTDKISLCGNYFEQDKMRMPVLLKYNCSDYIKSYDTIYELKNEDVFKLEKLKSNITSEFKINFKGKFFKILKKGLKERNLREKVCTEFTFSNFFIKASVERVISDSYIYILNPLAKNFNQLFLKKNVIKYRIIKINYLEPAR